MCNRKEYLKLLFIANTPLSGTWPVKWHRFGTKFILLIYVNCFHYDWGRNRKACSRTRSCNSAVLAWDDVRGTNSKYSIYTFYLSNTGHFQIFVHIYTHKHRWWALNGRRYLWALVLNKVRWQETENCTWTCYKLY